MAEMPGIKIEPLEEDMYYLQSQIDRLDPEILDSFYRRTFGEGYLSE